MKDFITELLVCPACLPEENPLRPKVVHKQGQDILEGSLLCPSCGRDYSICEGIAYLDPNHGPKEGAGSKYETPKAISSYLWGHFGDLLCDPEASKAYAQWADLLEPHSGLCLDVGGAVGRFAMEMTQRSDFVLGLDNSVAFIKAAKVLQAKGQMTLSLPVEGRLTKEVPLELPDRFNADRSEFIVADALFLPFKRECFSSLASLNMLDKVAKPLTHLKEINRVAKSQGVQCLISDPFSWSRKAAREEDWLGGKPDGEFSGRALDNLEHLFKGNPAGLPPRWKVQDRDCVWWKLRTHTNHFELIRSCYIKANR